jgi:hypothetical protein
MRGYARRRRRRRDVRRMCHFPLVFAGRDAMYFTPSFSAASVFPLPPPPPAFYAAPMSLIFSLVIFAFACRTSFRRRHAAEVFFFSCRRRFCAIRRYAAIDGHDYRADADADARMAAHAAIASPHPPPDATLFAACAISQMLISITAA